MEIHRFFRHRAFPFSASELQLGLKLASEDIGIEITCKISNLAYQ